MSEHKHSSQHNNIGHNAEHISHANTKSIHDKVMASIDTGKTKMKPHWIFMMQGILLVVGIIFAILALLYISSFIIFMLHQTGVWYTPGFGTRGVQEFLVHLPWVLIGLAILFMVLLQYLVKQYSFSYERPLLYSALGIVALVIIGGFVISLTPVHRGLMMQAQDDHLPFAGGFYKMFGQPDQPGAVTPGEITQINDNGYIINTPRNELFNVVVTAQTQSPPKSTLELGDRIVVIGDHDGDNINAIGIREVGDDIIMHRGHYEPREMPMQFMQQPVAQ